MTAQLIPAPIFKAWDNNGNPLAGGQLFTYAAGTLNKQATFTDSTQVTQNSNPVILNARGEASVWMDSSLGYKFILQDSTGNQIGPTQDFVYGSATGAVTFNGPVNPQATSFSFTTNGTGTANDVDFVGLFNGPNVLEYRAVNTGAAAKAALGASDIAGLGILIQGAGANFNGSLIAGAATSRAGAISTNYVAPLYFGTNATARMSIDGNAGALTFFTPTSPIGTSVQLNLNGTGAGNDIDITGPFNGVNGMVVRATNAGTSAQSYFKVADNSSLGLQLSAGGTGFTGTILTNGTAGRVGAVFTNTGIPLQLGTNNNARLSIDGSAGALTFNAPTSTIGTSVQLNLNGTGAGNDIDITGPFNGANGAVMRATNAGTSAQSYFKVADNSSLGLQLSAGGTGFTGTLLTGGPSGRAGAVFTNTGIPLLLGANNNSNLQIASNGTITVNATASAVATSFTYNLNGNNTGFDAVFQSSNNTGVELACAATGGGTAARSAVLATDGAGLGVVVAGAGSGFTGNLTGGNPAGRGGAVFLNYSAPLTLGINANANMIIGAAQTIATGQDISARGINICRFKASNTSRTSTTTPTSDPDLTLAITAAGTYAFQLVTGWATPGAAGTTPGLIIQVNYSGTFNSGAYTLVATTNTSFTSSFGVNVTSTNLSLGASNANFGAGIVTLTGVLQATTSGTLVLQWAQGVSSTNATTLNQGSYMTVMQVS